MNKVLSEEEIKKIPDVKTRLFEHGRRDGYNRSRMRSFTASYLKGHSEGRKMAQHRLDLDIADI